ncbi:unnamed protein product [Effrenium voratum]|uniref:Uncharacterized protein n=1 Tax=Effrenium voratum TaxID=2562239 RepID=A0AA36IZV3_9DINO|nr:unnamed protein product [Effrenium voratum]
MRQAICVLGKAGPGVCAEACACQVPLVVERHHVMPQEQAVLQWLQESCCGLVVDSLEQLPADLAEQAAACRQALTKLPPNDAVFEVADFLQQLMSEPGEASEGARLQGTIKEIGQEGGLILCPSVPEERKGKHPEVVIHDVTSFSKSCWNILLKEVVFTPKDLPLAIQHRVMSGDATLARSSVLFTLALAQGGRPFAKEVMIIPEPDTIMVGEVVQFNPSAGYGFVKPASDSIFQQDVYFNIKDLSRALTPEERATGLIGLACRFTLRLTPDNRPQGRKVEMISAFSGHVPTAPVTVTNTRFSYEPPPTALQPGV